MIPNIEIQHLSVKFDTAQGPIYAVNDLSTTFTAGRIAGVIGESGSGKSIMGMSLLRLLPQTATITGRCLFGENDLYTMPIAQLRKIRGASIGLIPQNPCASLDPVMKIRKQITEAIITHGKYDKNQANEKAEDLLRKFGFENPNQILNQYSFQMSGGMNQRLVSALGLACSPGWIIADEPTKGLDAVIRNQVYAVLKQIYHEHHCSMIVITHDLVLSEKLCDDIRVLYMGQIVEQGTSQEVMQYPLHPYTVGLIRSLPSRGMVPIPTADPDKICHTGCPFYPRCNQSQKRCAREKPQEYTLASGRKVRCFLYE